MKNAITILLLFVLASAATAQTPKLRMTSGIFTNKYELGDKRVQAAEVKTQLEKNDPNAYYLWRRADRADVAGTVWLVIGLVGTVVGAVSGDSSTALLGSGVAVVGYASAVVCIINSGNKRKRAVSAYNKKFGY